ncbi:MAG: hypothetical protein COY58_03910 [Gammaproteobacteria bacterium CG_4_10_14_0_8_um_filter_38_16]|nr:MAG: hypothetical protein COY58_03910 [Gammaproteobacteria bacterium CG_4_10_14_0_8_um_filter_38_16]PJA03207.1 MAG: hypothetical protein COX72_06435 [Gammaproteobacteria bacterium CG_4_10_14_0_2_um_filter_38_22]PJB10326.1 MAG: hypothetical protein CO120_05330 [Gammaproteobacteria bacterium CG_4_9_14_3_um_filter_38_9]
MNNRDFTHTLLHYQERVNQTLNDALTKINTADVLRHAMQYSVFNGGKRLRPALVYATANCFGNHSSALDPVAAAIECIHCYSLIHDDLPAMDDDSLRRGKPTCHIVFDEATAILAGDGLQALAFELLTTTSSVSAETQLAMIRILATHAGAHGMVAGQSLDLLSEGKTISTNALTQIHQLKTGALIQASVKMGALAAGCDDQQILSALDEFSHQLGFAFQLQDDLLDVIGNTKNTGKNTGQDIRNQKATFATHFGVSETQKKIKQLTQAASVILKSLTALNTTWLQQLCEHSIHREK